MAAILKNVRLDEAELKCAFLNHLRTLWNLDAKTVVASEFVIAGAGRRADIAMWCGEFVGIEIKSKFDSLKRLTEQIAAYSRCFDRVILVAHEKHYAGATEDLPDAIEFWTVDCQGIFTCRQQAGVLRDRSPYALANLCNLNALRRLASMGQDATRRQIIESGLNPEAVYASAIANFKRNFEKSSEEFWRGVGSGPIMPNDLLKLSRFVDIRIRQKLAREQSEMRWQLWEQQAALAFG